MPKCEQLKQIGNHLPCIGCEHFQSNDPVWISKLEAMARIKKSYEEEPPTDVEEVCEIIANIPGTIITPNKPTIKTVNQP